MADTETFNLDDFVAGSGAQGLSTRSVPIPVAQYQAYISGLGASGRKLPAKNPDDNPRGIVDVLFQLANSDPNYATAAATTGRSKLTSKLALWLDLTAEGKLDRGAGRNVQLGRLLAGAGLNGPQFQSFQQLVGSGPWLITIKHEADRNDPEVTYDRVDKFTKA